MTAGLEGDDDTLTEADVEMLCATAMAGFVKGVTWALRNADKRRDLAAITAAAEAYRDAYPEHLARLAAPAH